MYLGAVLAAPALLIIKLTFFILYWQLFRPIRGLRIAIWLGGIFTTLFYVAINIAAWVFTTPRRGETWYSHFIGPVQAKQSNLTGPLPAVGLAIDVYILVIPLIGISGLNMPTRRKIGVALVFLTAIMFVRRPLFTGPVLLT